jgi:hypothetical protein
MSQNQTQPQHHSFIPKEEILKRLKENCTAEASVTELLTAFQQMAASVGVQITCTVVSSNPDHTIDRTMFANGMQHCAAAIGVLAAGAKFNPKELIKGNAHAPNVTQSVQPGPNAS